MAGAAEPVARPLALTMGDPAGLGLELTLMAWRDRIAAELPPFVLIADPDALAARARATGIEAEIEAVSSFAAGAKLFAHRLPVLPLRLHAPANPGFPDPLNADAVIQSIERAVDAVIGGEAAAVVTNPIAKSVLYSAGFEHPGHTEFLAHLAEQRGAGTRIHPVMMLASDVLRVVPLTVHIPLRQVPDTITRELIERTARIMAQALKRDFGLAEPRIAVTGLNPHAGEQGSLGREEEEIIGPAVRQLRASGIAVSGPYPADTLFHAAARSGYDAVLAMYHDQALIPLKTLAFDTAVNVTLGLPFVRTSPDHGTGFDIAGQGRASAESLVAALRLAAGIAERRAGALVS